MVDGIKQESPLQPIRLPAIQQRILVVRERHAMLDEDLARLYGVETRRLIEQVKRNLVVHPENSLSVCRMDGRDLTADGVGKCAGGTWPTAADVRRVSGAGKRRRILRRGH
jgi:hypothetical protein